MGFKLKKKNGSDGAGSKKGGAFLGKIRTQLDQFSRLFGETEKSKPIIYRALIALVLAVILLIYLFVSLPRSNQLTRSLGELRLLSQMISRQATEATASGTSETMNNLVASEKRFAENLEVVEDVYGKSSDEYKKVNELWTNVSKNIDLIASQQAIINQLYDTNISISETIPEIQAEYNLMVDQMVRENMPSSQVIITKNQVFIAERILRSINSVLVGTDNSNASANDFGADIDTFGIYLNAQLNGSSELGVDRISSPDLRESLDSIKSDYDAVLKLAAETVLKNANQIVYVRQASSEIFTQSDALLSSLNALSDKAEGGWGNVLAGIALILALGVLVFSALQLLALRSNTDKERVTRLQDEYDRNQNAILRLLDEIADLSRW